jgi:AcrR family transcriptional regulator
MPASRPKPQSRPASAALRERAKEGRRAVYRQAVVAAAERVFAEKGIGAARMQEIATEAGIALGTLYAVIEGKDSLLNGIHRTRMDEFLDCIRAAADRPGDTLQRHLAVLRDGAQFFLDRPDFLRMCCRDGYGWATPLPDDSRAAALWNERAQVPRALFTQGIAEGIFVDEPPDLLVRKMLALMQVELATWVDEGMRTPQALILERLERQFIRAFCVPVPNSGARASVEEN